MDGFDIKTLAVIVNAVGNLAIGAWLYLDRKADKTNNRIDEIGNRVKELDGHIADKLEAQAGRISHLEAHAEDSPTHADLGELYNKLNAVDSKVSAQGGKLEGIDVTLRLILSRITERGLP